MEASEILIQRLKKSGVRFWANDNISSHLTDDEIDLLKEETAKKFEAVLRSLLIDIDTDPNSHETAMRLSKMYWDELFVGRYRQAPRVTAFPNEGEDKYEGLLVISAPVKSVCSHHHQPVEGTCFIGILPGEYVLGLSKYSRIVDWHCRRGTLQEELCQRIRKSISKLTESDDVAVYIEAEHGCCTNRGVMNPDSMTQTVSLSGRFLHELKNKEEFFDNIKMRK